MYFTCLQPIPIYLALLIFSLFSVGLIDIPFHYPSAIWYWTGKHFGRGMRKTLHLLCTFYQLGIYLLNLTWTNSSVYVPNNSIPVHYNVSRTQYSDVNFIRPSPRHVGQRWGSNIPSLINKRQQDKLKTNSRSQSNKPQSPIFQSSSESNCVGDVLI